MEFERLLSMIQDLRQALSAGHETTNSLEAELEKLSRARAEAEQELHHAMLAARERAAYLQSQLEHLNQRRSATEHDVKAALTAARERISGLEAEFEALANSERDADRDLNQAISRAQERHTWLETELEKLADSAVGASREAGSNLSTSTPLKPSAAPVSSIPPARAASTPPPAPSAAVEEVNAPVPGSKNLSAYPAHREPDAAEPWPRDERTLTTSVDFPAPERVDLHLDETQPAAPAAAPRLETSAEHPTPAAAEPAGTVENLYTVDIPEMESAPAGDQGVVAGITDGVDSRSTDLLPMEEPLPEEPLARNTAVESDPSLKDAMDRNLELVLPLVLQKFAGREVTTNGGEVLVPRGAEINEDLARMAHRAGKLYDLWIVAQPDRPASGL